MFIFLHFQSFFTDRFLKSEMLNSAYWAIYRPTTGAFSLFLALHTCDVVRQNYMKLLQYFYKLSACPALIKIWDIFLI